MSALIELAEWCEAATGADRGLDKAIWSALGNCNHERTKFYAVQSDTGFTCLDCGKDTYGAKVAPTFTSSIDAALMLLPEGSCVTVSTDRPAAACISGPVQRWVYAATPALALTAAALWARASMEVE